MLHLKRSIPLLTRVSQRVSINCKKLVSSSGRDEIEIPDRINRSSVDILKALR